MKIIEMALSENGENNHNENNEKQSAKMAWRGNEMANQINNGGYQRNNESIMNKHGVMALS